jgi:hypothetical protein
MLDDWCYLIIQFNLSHLAAYGALPGATAVLGAPGIDSNYVELLSSHERLVLLQRKLKITLTLAAIMRTIMVIISFRR